MVDHFYVQLNSVGVGVSAGINKASIVSDPVAEGLYTVRPVNEWMPPKNPRMTVFLFWPEGRDFEPGTASVEASFFIADPKVEYPEPLHVLAEFKWPLPDEEESYPYLFELPLKIQNPPPITLWDQAATLTTLSQHDRQQIVELVEQFRAALLGDDAAAAFRFVEERFLDDARAYGKDPGRVRTALLEQYSGLISAPGRVSDPLGTEEAVFDLVWDDRLVCVTRGDVAPAIDIVTADDSRYEIDVYVAKVDGKWIIAR